MTPAFRRIILVGLGQIGTSLGLGLRRAGVCRHILGVDREVRNLNVARRLGAITEQLRVGTEGDFLRVNLNSEDFIILAVPVRSILRYLRKLPRDPLVMDVGSTKGAAARLARQRRLRYVGAHPIAGSERSGPEAGGATLFRGHRCFLTLLPGVARSDSNWVKRLWRLLGAEVVSIDPDRHDRLFAAISHLPHAISFAFVRAVFPFLLRTREKRIHSWIEGSFRDVTRVAISPAEMWTDIFSENRRPLVPLIRRLRDELRGLELSLAKPNRLNPWIRRSRQLREALR